MTLMPHAASKGLQATKGLDRSKFEHQSWS